jgi:hypothetical protein
MHLSNHSSKKGDAASNHFGYHDRSEGETLAISEEWFGQGKAWFLLEIWEAFHYDSGEDLNGRGRGIY